MNFVDLLQRFAYGTFVYKPTLLLRNVSVNISPVNVPIKASFSAMGNPIKESYLSKPLLQP
jgi:hypothetical protein